MIPNDTQSLPEGCTMLNFTAKCVFLALVIISLPAYAAITLTGDVDADFTNENCLIDAGGQDIGLVGGISGTGFDIDKVCFYYDGTNDSLSIGISTINKVIFGDTDGDGDPGSSSHGGVVDYPNLGTGETIAIAVDLDGDSATSGFNESTVDALIGVAPAATLDSLGVYDVSVGFDTLTPAAGFGSTELAQTVLYATPSTSVRDLEFEIKEFKGIQTSGMASIINNVYLLIFADALVIGEDYLPDINESQIHAIFDHDEDLLEDWDEMDNTLTDPNDADSDDDELLDGTEVNGDNPTDPLNPDTDGDTCLDGIEDANHNGAYEPFLNEADPNQIDTDADKIDDCTELTGTNPTNPSAADTDGDGLLDGDEDKNQNGAFEPTLGETDPNKPDTDGGGVDDKTEIDNGFNPNDPTDDQQASEQINVTTYNQAQGGGCSLSQFSTGNKQQATVSLRSTIYDPRSTWLFVVGLCVLCTLRFLLTRKTVF